MIRWGWLAVALLAVGVCARASGQGILYGTFNSLVAIDPAGPVVLDDTGLECVVDYGLGDWTFECDTSFALDGLDRIGVSADGKLGDAAFTSSVVFYPIGEQRTKQKTRTEQAHLYDWGREYFVNWVEATNVNATSSWYIRVSLDGTSWTTVSPLFDSATHESGQIPVNVCLRYVETRATTGELVSTALSPERVTICYSKVTFQTRLKTRLEAGVTLVGKLTVASTGTSSFSLNIAGPTRSPVRFGGTVRFALSQPAYCFCFRDATFSVSFPFGCVDQVTADLKMSAAGFETASFSVANIDVGLSWLGLSGAVTFSTIEKTATFVPQLKLDAGPCLVAYGEFTTGATATEITGISIYGLAMSYAWESVKVSSLSYFDDYHYVPVRGSQACWESLTIATSVPSCCGGDLSLECTVGFARSSGSLFDWAETDVAVSLGFGQNVTVSLVSVVEVTGWTYASVGVLLVW